MHSKKRIIGLPKQTAPEDFSGIWDLNQVTEMREQNPPEQTSLQNYFTDAWPTADRDPFRKDTVLHVPPCTITNHMFRDQSSHHWDEYIESNNYYAPGRSHVIEDGPRFPKSTFFYDSHYTVTDHPDLQLGASAFTLEFWIMLNRYDTAEHYVMGKGGQAARGSGQGWVVYLTSGGRIGWYDAHNNTSTQIGSDLARDTWYHIAIVREGTGTSQLKIYVNGVMSATGTSTGNFTDGNNLIIGRDRVATAASYFGGYIADLRLSNSALYGAPDYAFTPPTTMYDDTAAGVLFSLSSKYPWHPTQPTLHPQGMTITAASSRVLRTSESPFRQKFPKPLGHGYSSVYTSGSTTESVLRIEDLKTGDDSLDFGTGPFTVEGWVFCTDYQREVHWCGKGSGNYTAAGSTGWSFGQDTNGYMCWVDNAAAWLRDTSNTANQIQWSSWSHWAAVREGTGTNQFKMYLNGKLVYTGTVATNYTDANPLRLFTDRQGQYWHKYSRFSCMKISKTARYTAEFTIDPDTFYDTQMTNDANTSLLLFTCGTDPVRGYADEWQQEGWETFGTRAKTSQVRFGQRSVHHPNGYSVNNMANTQNAVYARTTQGDFNFGTGDFSVELWVNQNYSYDNIDVHRMIFDCRTFWNDSGICLRYNQHMGLDVVTGNSTRLSDTTTRLTQNQWYHLCVQRVNSKLALYVNGIKRSETLYSGVISAPGADWFFGNGSYPNLWYTTYFYGYLSDIRIFKGSAAYSAGDGNPDSFPVPRSKLQTANDCVLLCACHESFQDYSGRNNFAWLGNRDEANYTTSYNNYMTNYSPYSGEAYVEENELVGDHTDNNGGWEGSYEYVAANGTWRELAWMQHMVRPWTIECWIYAHQANPASITNQTYLYTATGNSQNGWQLLHHYAGTANSYNDLTLIFRNIKYPTTPQYINTSGGNSNMKPHSYNHVAIVFDPTKATKVAIHCNGKRVATRAAFTFGDGINNHFRLIQNQVDCANVRISDSARYDNDSTTYSVPTQAWTYDANTPVLIRARSPFMDTVHRTNRQWHGTAKPCLEFSKWGTGSIQIPNLTSINTNAHDGFYYPVYNYWADKSHDHRWGDYTIEGWASWWDAGSGGKAFNTGAPGSCLIHWSNTIWIGADTAGAWKVEWANTATVYNTVSTGVNVATRSAGTWDHFAVVKYKSDWYVYINGVYYGNLIGSKWGTYASNGPTTSFNSDFTNIAAIHVGKEYDNLIANSWTGFLEDFRITRAARYWVREVDGVLTMCHIGTNKPALPTITGPFPTR